MNVEMSNQLDQKIIETMDYCIEKMADAIKKRFHINDNRMMSLFNFFCSCVKTRMWFIKSISQPKDKILSKVENIKQQVEAKIASEPVLSFTPPKKSGKDYENPIRPQDLQSGLLMKKG